ncbi:MULTISPECIES: DUF4304 domain-containing protein [Pseudomonas]|uniref:DUF4304 domain-containing protein n=1 Tax=Pseudomonas TaxID=286 RepID=UPI000D9D8C67|nr:MULTISPECIES: DUF4304 domain-containing protein [Pseudomonas]MBH3383438.1 DUF4304 domain-containing protein [Pseudomonas juntendi]MBR7520587.1 DUF4304 domain-containing protein [Pseudomonas juntendi]PYB96499.1 hypothetical protein DMX12_19980 [Pseudomonas sp. MB-090624]
MNALEHEASRVISDELKQNGFIPTPSGFIRLREHYADYISPQARSDNNAICYNGGVIALFLHTPAQDILLEKSELDCDIRFRITPPEESDFWIENTQNRDALRDNSIKLLNSHGISLFNSFENQDSICLPLSPSNIESGNIPYQFSSMTKSRLARISAMSWMSKGDILRAKELAHYGLSVCGMATTLKREFKKILAE